MNVGVCKVNLRLPENESLKGKRKTMASLCARLRNKFNVSIAEVGDNDLWQMATVGISCVSNSSRHADAVLGNVVTYIEESGEEVELVGCERETITGF